MKAKRKAVKMLKKSKPVLIALFFLFLGLKLALSEQDYYGKEKALTAGTPVIKKTPETKTILADTSSNIEKTNREILNKLNQVLNNQEKIMEELKIIKVRATRK